MGPNVAIKLSVSSPLHKWQQKKSIVRSPAQCFAAPDIKKRIKLKMTKLKFGKKMARKAKKTKRVNAASRRVAALNRSSR